MINTRAFLSETILGLLINFPQNGAVHSKTVLRIAIKNEYFTLRGMHMSNLTSLVKHAKISLRSFIALFSKLAGRNSKMTPHFMHLANHAQTLASL